MLLGVGNKIEKKGGIEHMIHLPINKIYLDAGHTKGANRGYVGAKWKNEGDSNYYYSLLLKKELEKYGFIVKLSRDKIEDARDLDESARMAVGYDLLLSLHTNAAGSAIPNADGTETFIGVKYPNIELTKELHDVVVNTLGTRDRGIKWAYYPNTNNISYYGILRYFEQFNPGKPSMMFEHVFHDNPVDVARWEAKAPQLAVNLAKKLAEIAGKTTGSAPSKISTTSIANKTDVQLADEVLQGVYGNGKDRKNALGGRYNAVQAVVTQKVNGTWKESSISKGDESFTLVSKKSNGGEVSLKESLICTHETSLFRAPRYMDDERMKDIHIGEVYVVEKFSYRANYVWARNSSGDFGYIYTPYFK